MMRKRQNWEPGFMRTAWGLSPLHAGQPRCSGGAPGGRDACSGFCAGGGESLSHMASVLARRLMPFEERRCVKHIRVSSSKSFNRGVGLGREAGRGQGSRGGGRWAGAQEPCSVACVGEGMEPLCAPARVGRLWSERGSHAGEPLLAPTPRLGGDLVPPTCKTYKAPAWSGLQR